VFLDCSLSLLRPPLFVHYLLLILSGWLTCFLVHMSSWHMPRRCLPRCPMCHQVCASGPRLLMLGVFPLVWRHRSILCFVIRLPCTHKPWPMCHRACTNSYYTM